MPSADTNHATLALVDRDPDVDGLGVVLDDEVLTGWLSEQLGRDVVARRRYLRYKHGTSCVAAVDVRLPGSRPRTAVVAAYARDASVKAAKLLSKAPPGSVLVDDPALRMVAFTPVADRALPGLRRWLDGDPAPTELAYKPHRRWVGRLDDPAGARLLRVYRPADLEASVRPLAALEGRGAPVPRLLRTQRRRGVAEVEFLPGATPDAADLRAVGEALHLLHRCAVGLPPVAGPAEQAEAVRQGVDQVALLLPHLTDRAAALAARLATRPARPSRPVMLHGDFSLDQVVVDPSGRASLIDLDRAGRGPAEADLGSLLASLVADGDHPPAALEEVLAGYGGALDLHAVTGHAAAYLLRRVGEPFRHGRSAWAEEASRLLDETEALLDRAARGGAR